MSQPADIAHAPSARPYPGFVGALLGELAADRALYLVIGGYLAAVWVVAVEVGRPEFYQPLLYAADRWPALVLALMIYVMLIVLPGAVLASPAQPFSAFLARLRAHASPRGAAGLALFLSVSVFTGAFTSMKGLQNTLAPFWADAPLARADAIIHFGVDPWRLLQPLLGHHAVTRFIQECYLNGWVMLLVGFTAAAAFSPRLAPVRGRIFLTFFAAWIGLGNLLAAAFMSGGPVYFGDLTGDHARFAEQVRYLSFSAGMANSSVDLQRMLWGFYNSGQVQLGSGISAFPSIHVATATLYALSGFCIHRWLGWAMVAFTAVILAGSVHLGWHYAIDGYVSIAFVLGVWFGLKRALKPAP